MPQPFVSVIIPVFNDTDRLLICLQHLQNQTYPRDKYEIIVIDNGSTEPVKSCQLATTVVLLEELQVGSYQARNKGLAIAQGEVIAFTDSDCQPAVDWLEMGVQALLAAPDCGLVGGRIQVFPHNPAKMTITEFYESLTAFPQEEYIEEYHFSAGANMFTWKRVVEEVGAFAPALKSSGDAEWGNRIHAHGYALRYADTAVVAHPARRFLREVVQKEVRKAGGFYDKNLPQQPPLKELLRGFLPPVHLIREALDKHKPLTVKHKLYLIFILNLLKYARGWETLRLRLGGQSRR
ncbi:MAG: glycosyltransferase [Ardenticatenaceae bacterium]|nr:glycosyltransferase [Ardenticatenaceae bacterium]